MFIHSLVNVPLSLDSFSLSFCRGLSSNLLDRETPALTLTPVLVRGSHSLGLVRGVSPHMVTVVAIGAAGTSDFTTMLSNSLLATWAVVALRVWALLFHLYAISGKAIKYSISMPTS
mmetsp:Transcript_327/g.344  ORF Transcript_327/g.344 Transcript_327/m.344 type:complete len:117 (+) Transcript_327:1288-1638(+)